MAIASIVVGAMLPPGLPISRKRFEKRFDLSAVAITSEHNREKSSGRTSGGRAYWSSRLWQKTIRRPVLLRFARGSYVGPRKGFASFHKADTSDLAPHKTETSDLGLSAAALIPRLTNRYLEFPEAKYRARRQI